MSVEPLGSPDCWVGYPDGGRGGAWGEGQGLGHGLGEEWSFLSMFFQWYVSVRVSYFVRDNATNRAVLGRLKISAKINFILCQFSYCGNFHFVSIFILWQFSYCGNLNYHQHNFNPSPFEVATVKKGIIVEKSTKEGFFCYISQNLISFILELMLSLSQWLLMFQSE